MSKDKKKKKDAIVKAGRQKVKATPLGYSASQKGISGPGTLQEILGLYPGYETGSIEPPYGPVFWKTKPTNKKGEKLENNNDQKSSVPLGSGAYASAMESEVDTINSDCVGSVSEYPDVDEYLAKLDDADFTADDVDVPVDAARTAILNATRSIAEISFRRAVEQLARASIFGASRGQIAKYYDLLEKFNKDVESGIVAGEHEWLQGKIAEQQIKANVATGKAPSQASVIGAVVNARMRGRISDSDHTQERCVRNAILTTQVSMNNADNDARIKCCFNSYLASVYSADISRDRGIGSILAAAISQMGEPGISWVD